MFVTTFNICMIHIRNEDFTIGSRTYSLFSNRYLGITYIFLQRLGDFYSIVPNFRIKTTGAVTYGGDGVVLSGNWV